MHAGRNPLAFSDLIRKIQRSGGGRDTLEQLNVITEQLCCEYVSRPADKLREDAHRQLEYSSCYKDPPGWSDTANCW